MSRLLPRHGTAQLAAGTARLPWHGCTATAPRAVLRSTSPKASPQSCLHRCACRCVSAGLFGDVPPKGPSDPQIFQKVEHSGCVQRGFFLEPSHACCQAMGVAPSHPPGALLELLSQGRVSGRSKRRRRAAGKILINNCKGDAWKPACG